MSASSVAPRAALEVLGPKARQRPPFPWRMAVMLAAALAIAVVNPRSGGTLVQLVDAATKLVALVAAVLLAAWLEERWYVALVGRNGLLRVIGAMFAPLAFLGLMLPAALAVGLPLDALGDEGTSVLAIGLAALWAASAATGTAVVVLVDVVVSAAVQSFRGRVQLAVLSLVAMSGALSALVLVATRTAGEEVRRRAEAGDSSVKLELPGVDKDDLVRWISRPETADLVALLLLLLVAILAMPAVLSACGKLADAVMERVHPLSGALQLIGRGRLDVRVEEGGSRDFRRLSQDFNHMAEQLGLSRRMERAFGQYVSPQVLGRIREQHGEAALPPELREASVFFADIRGFTSMSERLEPAQVLGVLNRYFERVVPIIEEHEGYLDKFIGDAVVVVFNGPIDQPDHAERATRCAIALQEEVRRLNEANAFPEVGELAVGAGVATGPLVAGNVGSREHMEYTVIGDTVNLAARLTGHAPAGAVWVNQGNVDALPEDMPRTRLEPLSVKGKLEPVAAYRVWPVD